MANKDDARKIFKHYRNMDESKLGGELSNIKSHTQKMKKMGISTTPEHEQSINYHLSLAKKKSMAKKMGGIKMDKKTENNQ